MAHSFSLVWFILYACLSIVFGVGNIILKNHMHIEQWWIAFYLENVDLSCGGTITNVEITDNANYKGIWLQFNSTIYGQYNQCAFLHQNAPFTAPLSVRITKNNDLHIITAPDVILSLTPDEQHDFGSNFCITTDHPSETTIAPTLYPSQTPTDSTPNPSKYPTINPTKTPTQIPTINPSQTPTKVPTQNPTIYPTVNPSKTPSKYPTINPSINPTIYPTLNPSYFPTLHPTLNTAAPTPKPTNFIVAAYPTISPSQSVSSKQAQETSGTVVSRNVLKEANDTTFNGLIKTLIITICILTVIIISLLICYCYKNKNKKKGTKKGGQHIEMRNIQSDDSDEQQNNNKCKETPPSSANIETIIPGLSAQDSLQNVVKIQRADESPLSDDEQINVIDIVMNNNNNNVTEGYQDVLTTTNNVDILDIIDGHSDSEDLYGESLKEKEYVTPIGDKHEKTTTMGPDIEDDDNYKD